MHWMDRVFLLSVMVALGCRPSPPPPPPVDAGANSAKEARAASVSGNLTAEKFALAIHLPAPHIVISDAPSPSWVKRAPATLIMEPPGLRAMGDERAMYITRKDAVNVPRDLAGWVGKKVELFHHGGRACEGRVRSLSIVNRVIPSIFTVSRWENTGNYQAEPKLTGAEIAELAWSLNDEGRLLVGDVEAAQGNCAGALWGRLVGGDAPAFAEVKSTEPATLALALAEISKSEAYAQLQARYASERAPKDAARWEDFAPRVDFLIPPDRVAKRIVRAEVLASVFTPVVGHPIVTLSLDHPGSGCGNFQGRVSAAWELKGKALSSVRSATNDVLSPLSAVDVDGDGKLDLILREGVLRWKDGKLDVLTSLPLPNLDEDC